MKSNQNKNFATGRGNECLQNHAHTKKWRDKQKRKREKLGYFKGKE